jgi:hypothetical protein
LYVVSEILFAVIVLGPSAADDEAVDAIYRFLSLDDLYKGSLASRVLILERPFISDFPDRSSG